MELQHSSSAKPKLIHSLIDSPEGPTQDANFLAHPIVHNERPVGTPSPGPRRLMKAPFRATLSPKGERDTLDG